MTAPNKRLDDLAKADTAEGRLGIPKAVEAQLTAFAEWRLPRQEAVDLLGERQLDERRHRLMNLAQWRWVRRGLGEAPGGGDGIQIASEIAS